MTSPPKIWVIANCTWLLEPIAQLDDERALGIDLIVVSDIDESTVRRRMAETTVLAMRDARRLDVVSRLGGRPDRAAVDEALVRQLAPYESNALHILDRRNWSSAPIAAVRHIYLRHVGAWQALLDQRRPDAIVFFDVPHRGFDYVLYALAKVTGVATVIARGTHLSRRLLVLHDVEELPAPATDDLDLAPLEWERVFPPFMQDRTRWTGRTPSDTTLVDRIVRPALRRLPELVRTTIAPRSLDYPDVVPDVPATTRSRARFSLGQRWRSTRLLREYERISVEPDLDHPYVFVPLHLQPEMTTVPLGGPQHDQLNDLGMLLDALPPEWRVVVKEHPQTFVGWSEIARARSVSYYRELAALDSRVDIAALSVSSDRLIEGARAVATITGSAAWEAIVQGTPTLVFGYPWFLGCEGVTRVTSTAQIAVVLEEIDRTGGAVDIAAVRRFVTELVATRTMPGTFLDAHVPTDPAARASFCKEFAARLCEVVDAAIGADRGS